MNDEWENRLVRLEELAAHQAKTIEDLSDELARHYRESSAMRHTLDRLTERLLSFEEQTTDAPAITKPPHY